MRILFDYTAFTMQAVGGVSRSMAEIFNCLCKSSEHHVRLFAGFHRNSHLNSLSESSRQNVIGVAVPPILFKQRIFMPINRLLFEIYARYFKPDICQYTYYDAPKTPDFTKNAVFVYDLIHEKFPDDKGAVEQRNAKSAALSKSSGIVCISDNTLKDLHLYYNVESKLCVSIPLGISLPATSQSAFNIEKPFFLYVGKRNQDYKNFKTLIKASENISTHKKITIASFGGGRFTDKELAHFSHQCPEIKFIHLNGNDEHLRACYEKAVALVYPSKYEGFGLPPLEAMSVGCPVISSSAPPMNTLLAGAALFFDPESPEELAEQMRHVLALSENERQKIISQGKKHAEQFTWEKTCNEILRFYASLLEENPA